MENKKAKQEHEEKVKVITIWDTLISRLGISRSQGKPITAMCDSCGWYTCNDNPSTVNAMKDRHIRQHNLCTPRLPRGETSPSHYGKLRRKERKSIK
jgi:hypothetical protein